MYCRSVDPFKPDNLSSKYSVVAVPCLEDNYAYLLIDEATRTAAAFDPVEPAKVLAAAEKEGVALTTVLTTHHHWDHAGGNDEIKALVPGIEIVGSAIDNVEGCTHPVSDEDVVSVGKLQLRCMVIPGHTLGSVCYYLADEADGGAGAVFTGDVLFVAGCGRVMEGEPEGMWGGIASKLLPLPDETRVFVGHEYTITNLHFALSVDPANSELKKMMEWSQEQRIQKGPTVPTTMAWEKQANPFVRAESAVMIAACGCSEPVDVFAALREKKNNYSPPSL
jgi:hydroxyacylglutathione hydrolase